MHDIRWIRENPVDFDRALARRGLKGESENVISIDERRRAILRVLEGEQAKRNAVSKEIGLAKANKDEAAVRRLMADVEKSRNSISAMEIEEKAVDKELKNVLAQIPNLPLEEVPEGKDSNSNVERHHYGAKRSYDFGLKQHFELGEALGQMDFSVAAKLSGARFVVLRNGLARLERALGQFMLDMHTGKHGYTEVAPPLLVRDDVMFGTAQLPKFADDQYASTNAAVEKLEKLKADRDAIRLAASNLPPKIAYQEKIRRSPLGFIRFSAAAAIKHLNDVLGDLNAQIRKIEEQIDLAIKETELIERGLWLIPTAEVPLTNLVRESIVDEAQLPMRFTACTPCFRAEAGAAGKDTRGMMRQHQFTKVELVSITAPEQSKDEHERMLACAEGVLKKLDLHYRVMILSTGDMGFASQKTYDIEVWLPGQNMYREISSCSICGEFQARRMNARYRTKEGRAVRHVHTLNGSGVAVGRALIAVMETYQQADGSIAVPDALQGYMGGMKKIEK
jgi:seryl-tRNA synthetase